MVGRLWGITLSQGYSANEGLLFPDADRHQFVVFEVEVDVAFVESYTTFAPFFIIHILFEEVVADHEFDDFFLAKVENLFAKEDGVLIGNIDTGEGRIIALKEKGDAVSVAEHRWWFRR